MNKSSYVLIALVALTLIAPALAMAESENEANEGTESGARESGEHEGTTVNSNVSNLVLYVTLATIAGVGGISAITVHKARRKAATKKLV